MQNYIYSLRALLPEGVKNPSKIQSSPLSHPTVQNQAL